MTYPPQQPGSWTDPQQAGWSDPSSGAGYGPSSGAGYGYVDPVTGQPAYPTSPPVYPQQPSYGTAYPAYAPPMMAPTPGTNGMAVASLVLSLCGLVSCGLTSIIGAILGHVARRQIRERGEGGDGLALGGIIAGWIIFALSVVGFTLYVIFFIWLYKTASNVPSDYPTY